jgi:phosphorylase kinase alpha/beta subunit
LRALRAPSGLFLAGGFQGVATGYDKSWLRDNFYEVMAFQEVGDKETTLGTWHALLDIFIKHEDKIAWAVRDKPRFTYQYIHARYHPETFEEFWEEWGNKQNDAVGCVLFALALLEEKGWSAVRGENDKRIVQRLADYLVSVEYWHDTDNGIWEEYEEVHASSVGACFAGLTKAREVCLVQVSNEVLAQGEQALRALLPRESRTKFCDLALLSLIFPYDVATEQETEEILRNIPYHLTREKGEIRYKNDRYYNKNEDGWSEEAEWTMGFPWLSIIYRLRGEHERADYFLERMRSAYDEEGKLPELYFSHTDVPNENNPLGWSESLAVVALHKKKVSKEGGVE